MLIKLNTNQVPLIWKCMSSNYRLCYLSLHWNFLLAFLSRPVPTGLSRFLKLCWARGSWTDAVSQPSPGPLLSVLRPLPGRAQLFSRSVTACLLWIPDFIFEGSVFSRAVPLPVATADFPAASVCSLFPAPSPLCLGVLPSELELLRKPIEAREAL